MSAVSSRPVEAHGIQRQPRSAAVATTSVTTQAQDDERCGSQWVPSAPRFARRNPRPLFRKSRIKPRSCAGEPTATIRLDVLRHEFTGERFKAAARGPSINHCGVASFDHLVCAGEQRRRNVEPQDSRGGQVDEEVELGRLNNWQVSRLLTAEDATHIDADQSKRFR
jgi:hypothetical protein